jgi:hypothetical protein
MCASRELMELDMDEARTVLESRGEIKSFDEMMIVSQWNEMEVTLYPQGKIMFYPLSDKDKAVEYATEIMTGIIG